MTLHLVDPPAVAPAVRARTRVCGTRARPSFPVALVLASAAVAAAQRGYAQAGHDAEDVWLGFTLAAALWGWLCLAYHAARKALPRSAAAPLALLLALAFYLSLCTELTYTYFYAEAQDRELSLLSVGLWNGLWLLFGQLLTPRGTALLAGLIGLAHLVALAWTWRGPALPRRALTLGYAAPAALSLLTAVGGLAIDERIRSPFADVGRELVFLATTPRLDLTAAPRLPYDARVLARPSADDARQTYGFDRVLVFVMETMIARDLEEERRALPAQTFLQRALPRMHRYTAYHASNQDSRTGMLAMLTSHTIPYEAYAPGAGPYAFVSRIPSLVDRFNARGYETAYTVSHADREEVISDLPWKQVLLLPRAEVDALRQRYLCVTVYAFEYGCEDRALLPKIFRVLDEHEKVFLFHEFIWGHDPEYNELSGRSNADYYSTFLDRVVEHLQQTGKLERTLIVLTSDHGYRGRSTLAEGFAYHIPLWFYAPQLTAREDARLLSHIDFQQLLLHELGTGQPLPAAEPFVAVVGPTGISSLTLLDAVGELALIRTRGNTHFLLAHALAPGQRQRALQPAAYARLFEDYRAYFDGLAARFRPGSRDSRAR